MEGLEWFENTNFVERILDKRPPIREPVSWMVVMHVKDLGDIGVPFVRIQKRVECSTMDLKEHIFNNLDVVISPRDILLVSWVINEMFFSSSFNKNKISCF